MSWVQLGLAIGQRKHTGPKVKRVSKSKPIRKKPPERTKTLFDVPLDPLDDPLDDLFR